MNPNRRSFLKRSSMAMACWPLLLNKDTPTENAFVHHALFWLKDRNDQTTYKKIVSALRNFEKVKGVKFLHVGSPSVGDVAYEARATDTTYSISYLTLFESKKDKENYLTSPLHGQFFKDFKDVISKVVIYDSLNIAR